MGLLGRFVKRVIGTQGLEIARRPRPLLKRSDSELRCTLEMVASHLATRKRECLVLQIGANDGVMGDPVRSIIEAHGWPAILVEPQPDVFEDLKHNYAGRGNVVLKNVAIGDADGERTLYRVRPDAGGPVWLRGMASFDRDVLMSNRRWVPDLASMVEEISVRCVTFDTLFRELDGRAADILQIDAEGYDYELIKMYRVAERRPSVLQFEHRHLKRSDWDECVGMLLELGYQVTNGRDDTIAYQGAGACRPERAEGPIIHSKHP